MLNLTCLLGQPLNETFSFRKSYFHENPLPSGFDRTFYCRLWSLFSLFPLVLKKLFERVGQSDVWKKNVKIDVFFIDLMMFGIEFLSNFERNIVVHSGIFPTVSFTENDVF